MLKSPLGKWLLRNVFQVYSLRGTLGRGAGLGVRILLVQDDQVMLVKHTYQPWWFFPGGAINHRESPMQAAVREAREEVGAIVQGDPEFLGMYSNFSENKNDHSALFATTKFTLSEPSDAWEIEERGFFPLRSLPAGHYPGMERRVAEYLAGMRGLAKAW